MPARTVRFGSLCRAAVLSVLWLVAAPVAFAQNKNATNIQPGDLGGDPEEKDKDGKLPAGLIQAREVLPEMLIDNELITDGQIAEFKKKDIAFLAALKSTTLNDEEKKLLEAGAKYHIYLFTLKKYREEEAAKKKPVGAVAGKNEPPKERLHDLRKKLLGLITLNAKNEKVREYFLKQVTERCAELLDNNFVVRQNIILLLGQLPINNGIPAKGVEPSPYDPAYLVLLKVIKDEKQHEALKVDALVGLLRICRLGLLLPDANNDKKRAEIAMTLIPELVKKETHWWYQCRLAECLGAAGVTYDPANKSNPIVLQTLAEVVVDKKRDLQARVEAAKAIGRLPLDSALNLTPVVYEIVNLGHQIVQAANANPKRESWGSYFFSPQLGYGLYFAFHSETGSARVAGGKRKPGLLEAFPNAKEIQDAYAQILQMTLHFIDNFNTPGKPFSATELKGFDDWLRSHVPMNRRITNSSPPLGSKPEAANGKTAPPTSPVAGGSPP